VAEEFAEYLDDAVAAFREAGIRADVDHSDERMQKKIRNHTTGKVPLILIAGEQDRAAGTVSFRFRDGTQENGVPLAEAVERVRRAVESHALIQTAGDLA
jgi:threonyl-tRNA synthetase